MGKIVFLGDSVTKGTDYGGVSLSQTFCKLIGIANGYSDPDIINSGVGGNNSAQALERLDTDVIAYAPDVCVILLGNNDCQGSNALPAPTMAANVKQIIVNLRAASIKPVLMSMAFERGTSALIAAYMPYLRSLDDTASSEGVDYVDIYREFSLASQYMDTAVWTGMFADLLHLAPSGHQYIADFAARARFSGVFVAGDSSVPPSAIAEPLARSIADYILLGANADRLAEISALRGSV